MDSHAVTSWRRAILSGDPSKPPDAEAQEAGRDALLAYASSDDLELKLELADLVARVYMRVALAVVRNYAIHDPLKSELEAVARFGLAKAIRKVEISRGYDAFYEFVRKVVHNEIARFFSQNSWKLKVPEPLKKDYLAVHRGVRDFYEEHGYDPSEEELSAFIGMSIERIQIVRQLANVAGGRMANLNQLNEMEQATLCQHQLGSNERGYAYVDLMDAMARLHLVDELYIPLLRLKFAQGLTHDQIAQELGISNKMQVSRMLDRALSLLRDMMLGTPAAA